MGKILIHEKDFKIIQERPITEYFIWDCPECKKHNKTNEWTVKNMALFCSGCYKYFTYSWKDDTNSHNPHHTGK